MLKGSKNREKQKLIAAGLHEKIANQRKDFLHKRSRQIADVYDCVRIENLDMKAMSQAPRFGKSVSDNAWGMFAAALKYKLEEQGKQLVKVDKFFASSQICSRCGYKNFETRYADCIRINKIRTVGHTGIARLCCSAGILEREAPPLCFYRRWEYVACGGF